MLLLKALLLPSAILIFLASTPSSGFACVAPRPRCRSPSTLFGRASSRIGGGGGGGGDSGDGVSIAASSNPVLLAAKTTRRGFLGRSIPAAIAAIASTAAAATTISPPPAIAKDTPVITKQSVEEAFDAIRHELHSPDGVVSTLTDLINSGSNEEVMQYTKESDAYFRKAKLGKARKLLTDDKLRGGDSIYISNAVTFDLIGINRASRPGKVNKDEQLKYLDELRRDIEKFLDLEGTIEYIDGE
ncbi:hypothetical protein ACHAW5_007712 [Stephanodiscus triporus]|uniref:Uncharacterized protein n=1 Tax=Stephanodiscus triporus TaxID=2934178 RepID=A0ABD3MS41_9STRA